MVIKSAKRAGRASHVMLAMCDVDGQSGKAQRHGMSGNS